MSQAPHRSFLSVLWNAIYNRPTQHPNNLMRGAYTTTTASGGRYPETLIATATDVISALASLGMSLLLATLGLDCLSALYSAYNRAQMRLDDEEWLRTNCKDPIFFSKMRAHTTVCAEVEANARVGAFWGAMRDMSHEFRPSLQPTPWILTAILLLCIPGLCTCCSRRVSGRFASGGARRMLPLYETQEIETAVCCKEA